MSIHFYDRLTARYLPTFAYGELKRVSEPFHVYLPLGLTNFDEIAIKVVPTRMENDTGMSNN